MTQPELHGFSLGNLRKTMGDIADEDLYALAAKWEFDTRQNEENDRVDKYSFKRDLLLIEENNRLMKVPSLYPKITQTLHLVTSDNPESKAFWVWVESAAAEKALRDWANSDIDWKRELARLLTVDIVYYIGNGHRAMLSDDLGTIRITRLPEVKTGVMNSGYTVEEQRQYEQWEFVPPITATNFK